MGTRWSKGLELGVVAVTLGLAFACGGKYDVGSGETGGQAGEGGAGETGSGGSNVSGQGGGNPGGSTSSGGQTGGVSGDTSGGTAGASSGGVAGASGSSLGGSAGMGCDALPEQAPEYDIASPDVVWDRLNRFLHGETRSPSEPLPETTTIAWVQESVVAELEEQYLENGRAPAGLEDFFRDWALEGEAGASAEFWASLFARGDFTDFFFTEVDGRVSFMSDRDFLVVHDDSTKRGIWMAEKLFLFDVEVPQVPDGMEISPVPGKTSRQVMEEAVSQSVCIGCHTMFDPLGFSLEHYDALGNYRTTENGLPIDASGTYDQASEYLEFSSIDDLAGQLPTVCEVQGTFAQELLEYALVNAHEGAPPQFDPAELRNAIRAFRAGDLRLARLLMSIVSTPAFLRE